MIEDARRLFIKSKLDKVGIKINPMDGEFGIEIEIPNMCDLEDAKNAIALSEKYGFTKSCFIADDGNLVIQLCS